MNRSALSSVLEADGPQCGSSLWTQRETAMPTINTPYVHVSIDAVDAVILDPEGHYDPDRYDHYPTFEAARDAALSSVEVMLDEGDYDGDDHRQELERMRPLLESATSFDDLLSRADYRWFLDRFDTGRTNAA